MLYVLKSSQFSSCSKSKEGNQTLYRKITGDDGVLICMKKHEQYVWSFLDGKIYAVFASLSSLVISKIS